MKCEPENSRRGEALRSTLLFSGSEVLYGEVLSTTLISDVKSMGTKGEKINFHVSPDTGEGLLAGVRNECRW